MSILLTLPAIGLVIDVLFSKRTLRIRESIMRYRRLILLYKLNKLHKYFFSKLDRIIVSRTSKSSERFSRYAFGFLLTFSFATILLGILGFKLTTTSPWTYFLFCTFSASISGIFGGFTFYVITDYIKYLARKPLPMVLLALILTKPLVYLIFGGLLIFGFILLLFIMFFSVKFLDLSGGKAEASGVLLGIASIYISVLAFLGLFPLFITTYLVLLSILLWIFAKITEFVDSFLFYLLKVTKDEKPVYFTTILAVLAACLSLSVFISENFSSLPVYLKVVILYLFTPKTYLL